MSRSVFSRRNLIALISFGVGTLVLGFLLSAFLPGLYGERTAGPSSYSRSLIGHRALVEWLERLDLPVVRCRSPHGLEFRSEFAVLLLEPIRCSDVLASGPPRSEDELGRVLARVAKAGATAVVVLPKRTYRPDPERPVWVGSEWVDRSVAEEVLERAIPERARTGDAATRAEPHVRFPAALTEVEGDALGIAEPTLVLKDPQVLAPAAVMEPLLQCREGILIGRLDSRSQRSCTYVISDPDLLNNRGLAKGDHAALVHALLFDVVKAEGAVVEESLHGFRSERSALRRAFSFPLVLIVLHALLLAGLFAWAASARFGKALTPPPALPPGKSLLLQNTGRLFLASGNHGSAVRRYLRAGMADVAERFTFGQVASGRDLTERMVALTRARGLPFDLPEIARAARNRSLTPAEAVELALKVRAWRIALERPGQNDDTDRPRRRERPGRDA